MSLMKLKCCTIILTHIESPCHNSAEVPELQPSLEDCQRLGLFTLGISVFLLVVGEGGVVDFDS